MHGHTCHAPFPRSASPPHVGTSPTAALQVGGGPTGVELAAELHDLVKEDMSRIMPTIRVRMPGGRVGAAVHELASRRPRRRRAPACCPLALDTCLMPAAPPASACWWLRAAPTCMCVCRRTL